MKVVPTEIEGVLVLEPSVFEDTRGFFMETFNQRDFDAAVGRHIEFVQDNHSRSVKGVLRGLHYQIAPHAQGKLVRVVSGSVFDVAVDLRPSSTTFGRWIGFELDARRQRLIWLPPGLAHGFLVTSDSADFLYKTTDYYSPSCERALRWCDPDIGIRWPDVGGAPSLSPKDAAAPPMREAGPFT
jgi:dTDP-4-dehydrorhamnose 3,5-epimerase